MWNTGLRGVEDVHDQVVLVVVEPVREKDWPDVYVVGIVARRAVDDNGARKTIDVLATVMAMPPRCTV